MSQLLYESALADVLDDLPEDASEALIVLDDRIRSKLQKLRTHFRVRWFRPRIELQRLHLRHIEAIYHFVTETRLEHQVPAPTVNASSRSFPAFYANFLDRMDQIKLAIRIRTMRPGDPRDALLLDMGDQGKVLNALAELKLCVRALEIADDPKRAMINLIDKIGDEVEARLPPLTHFYDLFMRFSGLAPADAKPTAMGLAQIHEIARILYKAGATAEDARMPEDGATVKRTA